MPNEKKGKGRGIKCKQGLKHSLTIRFGLQCSRKRQNGIASNDLTKSKTKDRKQLKTSVKGANH